MDTKPLTTSTSALLPPLPPRGAHAPAVDNDEFRAMLATQGIQPPASGGAPNATEAQIAAAQIASKANVHAALKRGRVMTGMNTAPAPVVAAPPGRFMPLREGPGAARNFTAPVSSQTTVNAAGLRATTKFAPGPVVNPNLEKAVPAVARALKRTGGETNTPVTTDTVPPPNAAELYTYGMRAAAEKQAGVNTTAQVPPWFSNAMQDALDKYDAMKAAPKP